MDTIYDGFVVACRESDKTVIVTFTRHHVVMYLTGDALQEELEQMMIGKAHEGYDHFVLSFEDSDEIQLEFCGLVVVVKTLATDLRAKLYLCLYNARPAIDLRKNASCFNAVEDALEAICTPQQA